LKGLTKLGLKGLFDPLDLYENKNFLRVLDVLLQLQSIATANKKKSETTAPPSSVSSKPPSPLAVEGVEEGGDESLYSDARGENTYQVIEDWKRAQPKEDVRTSFDSSLILTTLKK